MPINLTANQQDSDDFPYSAMLSMCHAATEGIAHL